jgi:RNA polymerase sigma-70 factor (ECF subfamily)
MKVRSNADWLADLKGADRDLALEDLRALLLRGLTYALGRSGGLHEETIEDLAQDALLRILDKLETFRGESQFTTWAQKIAIHTALTELRRRRWQDVSLNGMADAYEGDFVPPSLADETAGPEQMATQGSLLKTVQRLIQEELTDRQRQALTAIVVQGMPLPEVARRMNTNANALYKLLHDARKRLKQRMHQEGLTAQDVMAAFET